MVSRPFTLDDASTRPQSWVDAQDAATIALDANGRLASWAFKGTQAGQFTPVSASVAPLYTPADFAGAFPAFKFTATRVDLITAAFTGPSQPCTVVYVWQEPSGGQNPYCVVADHRSTGGSDGGRVTVFNAYAAQNTIAIVPSNASGQRLNLTGNAFNKVNVMVVEYNGPYSRIYLNGVTTQPKNLLLSSVIFGGGMTIGGKFNDAYTAFNGLFGEQAVYPVIFNDADWDKITQGTSWKWGQQASIPDGATYKAARPMVSDGTPDPATPAPLAHAHAISSPTASFRTPAAVDPLAHSHAATSPTLTAGTTMAAQDMAQAHAATSPGVSSKQAIAANSLQHAHTETPTSLLYQTTVAALSSIQAQAMTAAGLGAGGALVVNSAAQAHAAAAAALTARRALVSPSSLTQPHALAAAAFTHVSPPDNMTPDPLDFGVDLGSIRDRVILLKYFLSVTDVLDASEALDETLPAAPPAAFVGVASERAEPNKTIGGHSQRVRVEIAILFAESTSRFDREARDQLDLTRRALIRQLVAWTPKNAGEGLEYSRYRVVKIGDGLAWGEVTFTTSYRLTI